MSVSEAQIVANRRNSLQSCGPKTPEGKARSRGNALKHGLTGEGVALPVEDLAEVERLHRSFEAELKPSGDLGRTLVRRMALMAVRMDRSVAQESAALAERIDRAEAEFDADWPEVEGRDDPDREKMRVQAAHLAFFDPSKEAALARKYEAEAERCFFRSLNELRQVERQAKSAGIGQEVESARSPLGSFLPAETLPSARDLRAAAPAPKGVVPASNPRPKPVPAVHVSPRMPIGGSFDVPFSIGRAR
jgi:hypothetical protein